MSQDNMKCVVCGKTLYNEFSKYCSKTCEEKSEGHAKDETLDKKLDFEIHQTICPNCKRILNIPSEIINEDYIQCLGCNQTIHNPLKPEKDKGNFGCGKGCLIIFAILFVIAIFIGLLSPNDGSGSTSSNIEDQKIEALVKLKLAIKANLRDPESYQNVATDTWILEEYIFVKNTFRGKNRYGGYELCTFVAQFNFNTKPKEWGITNNPSSDIGCRAIMIALP
jgi:ribosomal protein S27E